MKKQLFADLYENILKENDDTTSRASSLDGLKKTKATKIVNGILEPFTHGLFRDDDWSNITRIFKALTENDIPYELTKTFYGHSEINGNPDSKTWVFEINFVNEKGRPTILYGRIVASGAGSVESPLDKYDIVAYIS